MGLIDIPTSGSLPYAHSQRLSSVLRSRRRPNVQHHRPVPSMVRCGYLANAPPDSLPHSALCQVADLAAPLFSDALPISC
jgi:hypothetical protein